MAQLRRAGARTLDWVITLHVPGSETRDGCLAYSFSPGLAADLAESANAEPGAAARVLHSILEAAEPDPVVRDSTHMLPLLLSDRIRVGETDRKACVSAIRSLAPRVNSKRGSDLAMTDFRAVDSCAKVRRMTPAIVCALRGTEPPPPPLGLPYRPAGDRSRPLPHP